MDVELGQHCDVYQEGTVQLFLNLITRMYYLMSNTTFLSSVWSETRVLD